jgi:hypothetical protein
MHYSLDTCSSIILSFFLDFLLHQLRAYGASCFVEYVVAEQHIAWRNGKNNNSNNTNKSSSSSSSSGDGGGNSSDSGSSSSSPGPFPLEHFHYLPIPHGARSKRDQVEILLIPSAPRKARMIQTERYATQ